MANVVRTLPVVVTAANPVPLTTDTQHKWATVSIQSDFSNAAGSIIYIGDVNVSPTRYARALKPGDWFASIGSAIDPRFYYIIGSTTGLIAAVSGN